MFTAGGSHARLSCRQGTDLWIDMVCKSVPFFMPCSIATGPCSQYIESTKMSHYAALFMRSCLTFMTFMAPKKSFMAQIASPVYWTRRLLSLSQQRSQQRAQ